MASDNYTRRRASTRGMRTKPEPPPGPVDFSKDDPMRGDDYHGSVQPAQSMAPSPQVQGMRMEDDENPILQALRGDYQAGGFEGVMNAVGSDWYNIPEWQRTQILAGVRT